MNVLLIPLSVIFALSLSGSVVLFKFLSSSATIKKKSYKAGGAIAGFILIYGLLFTSFNSWYKAETEQKLKSETWTIRGTVVKEGASKHDGITVNHIPDSPSAVSGTNGEFRMEGVDLFPVKLPEGLPELQFESADENFHTRTIDLSEDNVEIKKEKKQIVLKKPIMLARIEGGV